MPQMMPLNWLYLYLLFFFTFMIFLIMIYYNQLPMLSTHPTPILKSLKLNKNFYWKW